MHQQILDYLTPVLGEATATNLLKHYCARMHLNADEIKASHLSDLADAMRPMLAVWLGSTGAIRVAQEIVLLGRGGNSK